MSTPVKSRLQQVFKLQAKIFNTTYNPTQIRTGSKYLTQKLKGEKIRDYYGPTDFMTTKQLNARFPLYKFIDSEEEYRLDILRTRKRRGKGAPTKKREAVVDNKKKKK